MKKTSKGSVLFHGAWPYRLVQALWVLFQSRMFFISFGIQLFPFYFWFQCFVIVSSCIVQISFQLNWIAYSLQIHLPYHHRKGWKEWGLVYVLARVLFKPICWVFVCQEMPCLYSSVILFSINPCFILLTLHIGGNGCFQGSICRWRGIHIYFFDSKGI